MKKNRTSQMNNTHMTTRGIDERAFPYDALGAEKPYYRARSGMSAKHRSNQEKFMMQTPVATSRRKEAFHAYSFKRKTVSDRPQSAPAYSTDLGGSLCYTEGRNTSGGKDAKHHAPPRPKMRPNSAHFLGATSSGPAVDLDVFPAPRPARSEHGGSRHVFVHPTPPTDNLSLLTRHERMFYTDHFAKLEVKRRESEKYKLDEAYNRESRYYDHKSTTLHAPSDEVITDYRLGRKQQFFPPRVVEHRKAGLQQARGVGQKLNNSIARNALGGFYC